MHLDLNVLVQLSVIVQAYEAILFEIHRYNTN